MRYLYQLTFLFALGFAVPTAMAQKATVKATALDDHRASIEWTGKASQWTVERKAWNDDFEILATLPGEVHSIIDSTLKINIAYTYKLSATTTTGTSIVGQVQVESHLEPPHITGIMPLTGESALIGWDKVDPSADKVILEAKGVLWSDFSSIEKTDAHQFWIIAHDLEPMLDYEFRLASATAYNISDVNAPIPYRHREPVIEWSVVPQCSFLMGGASDDEIPQRETRLSAFMMSRVEVTNQLYLKYCDQGRIGYPEQPKFWGMSEYLQRYPNHPVVNVSWYDAIGFCNWLSKQQDVPPAYDRNGNLINPQGCRLPTEAEWECVAHHADGDYPWGDDTPDTSLANFGQFGEYQAGGESHPRAVRSYPQTPGGFWDLAGNVWEWCQDWYDPDGYKSTDSLNPKGPTSGIFRVVRGGSWADPPSALRSCNRGKLSPDVTMSTVGFRVVQPMPTALNER